MISEANAISSRIVLPQKSGAHQPDDKKRYPKAPGYTMAEYPSLTFTRDNCAVITYDVLGAWKVKTPGLKLRVIPLEWFYDFRGHIKQPRRNSSRP